MSIKTLPKPAVLDTRPAPRLTDISTDHEVELDDASADGVDAPVAPRERAPLLPGLGSIEEDKGVLKTTYDVAHQPVGVLVSEKGVLLQVPGLKPRAASPIELMTINELAQRSMKQMANTPQNAVQLQRLQQLTDLVGADARARFSETKNFPSRDQMASDMAVAYLALDKPKDAEDAFRKLVATSSGTAEVRRHVDNVMAWNMKWDLVTKAKKTFDFSYFSIERDPYGYAYMGALLAAQLRGVKVTGITDFMSNSQGHGFSMAGLGADYMQELANNGVQIGLYDRPKTRAESLLKHGLNLGMVASDHDKFAVADAGTPDAEGETGGRNVAGAYHQDPNDNPKSWRDDSVQIKGATVTDGFVKALQRELDAGAVTMVKPEGINLKSRATELLASNQLMETWIRMKPLTDAEKAEVRAKPDVKQAYADALYDEMLKSLRSMPGIPDEFRSKKLTGGEQKRLQARALELANDVELRGSRAKYDALGGYEKAQVKILDQTGAASAVPGQRFNEIGPDLLNLIRGAQQHIVVQNPYIVMTEPMMKAFEEAAARGVKIDFVTNSPESTDSVLTQGFFLNDWKDFESRVPTARIFVATGLRKFHAKAFVIDGKISADTSYNADFISGLINGEIGAVTLSDSFANNLLDAIQSDLDDPRNKFKEWSIQRNPDGTAVRDSEGHPVAAWGPENDVGAKLLQRYKPIQKLTAMAARIKLLSSLRHPKP